MSYVLWLKCGADVTRQGGDPNAHHIFMTILLKAEADSSLKFDVNVTNPTRPSPEFKNAGLRHMPGLQTPDEDGIDQIDDILTELDKFGPRAVVNQEAEDATADIFRQFAFYIKDVNKDDKALLGEFKRINDHLEAEGKPFLNGDKPSYLDCLILPRIHSIRIASKALKDFDIPSDLSFIWKYLENGYSLQIFKDSSPCDQEIILHWAEKGGQLTASKRSQLSRAQPSFSHQIPLL